MLRIFTAHSEVACRERLGGMLRYYYRKAARPALFLDAGRYAASAQEVSAGDDSRSRNQTVNRSSSLTAELTSISTPSISIEFLAVFRFQSPECNAGVGRPSIFTYRRPLLILASAFSLTSARRRKYKS
jgi:hypothetical protein